ncbi:BnaCnng28860D [Brassica napus]|uniref:BnaCnng28860D protein n=2 Tax=Brassica TaxID=3705 RepID=A0A078IVE3_BRANA|nr:BnaCnng28860D [Brassica napus]
MREKHSLQDNVEMLGAVPHSRMRSVLKPSASLTEAFCIAILEAASCGLLTVGTRVGGVLPDDMVVLAEPDPDDMVRAIEKAISILPSINPEEMHNRLARCSQKNRAVTKYDRALKCSNRSLLERLSRFLSCGAWAGKVFCMVMIIDYLLWRLLQLLQPDDDIEEAPDINFRH